MLNINDHLYFDEYNLYYTFLSIPKRLLATGFLSLLFIEFLLSSKGNTITLAESLFFEKGDGFKNESFLTD